MKKKNIKKVLIAAIALLVGSIGFAMVAIFCEGQWRSVGIALCLLAFLSSMACFIATAAFSSDKGGTKGASRSDRPDRGYEKIFPHMTTDDSSTDEEKETDDYLIMDMMDEEDDE